MSNEDQTVICVRCPRGCEVGFQLNDQGQVASVQGNFCKLGRAHVEMELVDPRRTLTTTVRVKGGVHPLVPVWSEEPLPMKRVMELADRLREVELEAPVHLGDPVMEDALGLGIRVVTSGNVPAL